MLPLAALLTVSTLQLFGIICTVAQVVDVVREWWREPTPEGTVAVLGLALVGLMAVATGVIALATA